MDGTSRLHHQHSPVVWVVSLVAMRFLLLKTLLVVAMLRVWFLFRSINLLGFLLDIHIEDGFVSQIQMVVLLSFFTDPS